jgi:hypothetical protein
MKALSLFFLMCGNFLLFAQFAGGSGTEGDPYQVANAAQFSEMRNYGSFHFIQTANISLSGYSSGSGWEPFYSPRSYNGNGYKITGLVVNRPAENYVGLFEQNVFIIRNVIIENCSVTGYDYTGGLVGYNRGVVENCFVSGTVIGYRHCGGLAGHSRYAGTSISNCYSTCSVEGSYWVGGLVGYLRESSSVTNCYSTGMVTFGYMTSGGLIGCESDGGVVTNSFWDTETSGVSFSSGGTGKTSAEMKNCATFYDAGWNMNSIWGINISQNGGYPFLRIQGYAHLIFAAGTGTEANPWRIENSYHLNNVRYYRSSIDHFLQTLDIDLTDYSQGSGWNPIGRYPSEFIGSYDGGGRKITGLFINRPAESQNGLFGYVRNSTLKNIIIENCSVTGGGIRPDL